MEMHGLDSAKCQNQDKMGHKWNFLIANWIRRKMNSIHLLQKDQKTRREQKG